MGGLINAAALPYWSSEIDIEVSNCLSWGLDYRPVSGGTFFSPEMRRAASDCIKYGSELLFVASNVTGCVGVAVSDSFYKGVMPGLFNPGFMMVLSYSGQMENLVSKAIMNYRSGDNAYANNIIEADAETENVNELELEAKLEAEAELDNQSDEKFKNINKILMRSSVAAGIALCSLWNDGVLVGSLKVIAITSYIPFFDPSEFLDKFFNVVSGSEAMPKRDLKDRDAASYYAEKFGHMRFTMRYETDDPTQLTISRLLCEMELDATRMIVGPSPEADFPASQIIALPVIS